MPLYEYLCEDCSRSFEVRRGMEEQVVVRCAHCGSRRCQRVFGGISIVKSGTDRAKDVSWIDKDLARRLRGKSGGVLSPEFKQTLDQMESD